MSWLCTPEQSKKYFCIVNVSVKVNPTCNAKPKVKKIAQGLHCIVAFLEFFCPETEYPSHDLWG